MPSTLWLGKIPPGGHRFEENTANTQVGRIDGEGAEANTNFKQSTWSHFIITPPDHYSLVKMHSRTKVSSTTSLLFGFIESLGS